MRFDVSLLVELEKEVLFKYVIPNFNTKSLGNEADQARYPSNELLRDTLEVTRVSEGAVSRSSFSSDPLQFTTGPLDTCQIFSYFSYFI